MMSGLSRLHEREECDKRPRDGGYVPLGNVPRPGTNLLIKVPLVRDHRL
jgi:hypothetical protein